MNPKDRVGFSDSRVLPQQVKTRSGGLSRPWGGGGGGGELINWANAVYGRAAEGLLRPGERCFQ